MWNGRELSFAALPAYYAAFDVRESDGGRSLMARPYIERRAVRRVMQGPDDVSAAQWLGYGM